MRALGVGGAASHARGAVDEDDAGRAPVGQAQEIDCNGGAAEAGAYNDYGSR